MIESKYMLTNDFRILYCPNLKLKLSCKELDTQTMDFSKYNDNLDLLELFFKLESTDINFIINNIFNAKIGIELHPNDMKWIMKFDELLSNDVNILNNKELTFNYCVLKLKLIGFPEEMALKIASTQFINEELSPDYPHCSIFIDKINEILDKRKYWIPHKVETYKTIERNYFKTIFTYKKNLKLKYDFSVLKDGYMKVIENSFVPYLIEYNSTYSYLIRQPIPLLEQTNYIKECYNHIIVQFLLSTIKNDFPEFMEDEYFIHSVIGDLLSCLNLYIEILLEKETK